MNTARIATVAALAVALLVPVTAPASAAAAAPTSTGLVAMASTAPLGVVASVKSTCKQQVSRKAAKKWTKLKVGSVSKKARWVNKQFALGSSKRYSTDTARSMRAFERAVKVKANGVVSARDWCLLKELVEFKRPAPGNGSGGGGGNSEGGVSEKDPFDTGGISWSSEGEGGTADVLKALRYADEALDLYMQNDTDISQSLRWRNMGERLETLFVAETTALLVDIRAAHDALESARGTSREAVVREDSRRVWHRARLFIYAQFTVWGQTYMSDDVGRLVSYGFIEGGPSDAAVQRLAEYQRARDTYAASPDPDMTLIAASDQYLSWLDTHLERVLLDTEKLLLDWIEASTEGEEEWAAAFGRTLDAQEENQALPGVVNSDYWFGTISEGGDPRQHISAP